MALTAFPTITINSSTGSDTTASGDGGVSCTGTATSVNSTTIALTITGGTLTGVAQDGSAVLWISGVGFVRISTTNIGAVTVVVETALTCTAATFAIGGARATINGTESLRLFAATATPTASGASGQWSIVVADASISISASITMAFTAGNGCLNIRGSSASSRCVWTQSSSATHFTFNAANRIRLSNFQFKNSNGTPLEVGTCSATTMLIYDNCICGDSGGSNPPKSLHTRTGNVATIVLINTSVLRCTGIGITGAANVTLIGSEISRCGGVGISNSNNSLTIIDSVVSWNTGSNVTNSVAFGILLKNSTFDSAQGVGDGVTLSGNNLFNATIINCNFTSNGTSGTAYGLNLSGTAPHDIVDKFNNFFGNRTAAVNGFTVDASDLALDPGYTNNAVGTRNYSVGTNMKSAGFPASTGAMAAGQLGCTSYVDIGAAQRIEPTVGTPAFASV